MRINGFEQIKSFNSWLFNNAEKQLTTSHVALYYFLINQNNRNNWVEWFKLPYDLGMSGSCIGSRNTYYKCLEDLRSFGLIEYQKGINNYKAPLIKLCLFKNEQLTNTAPVPLSEPLTKPLTKPLPEHIYKLITGNLELVTNKLHTWIANEKRNEKEIPTFEDFKTYALEQKKDIDIEALELKYKSWVSNDWKTGGEKPREIQNWKNTLLNTLPYLKQKEKKTFLTNR